MENTEPDRKAHRRGRHLGPGARSLHLYVKDPTLEGRLDMLAKLWHQQGKIARASKGEAVVYMARGFGEMAKSPLELGGHLSLDPARRKRFSLLGDIFKYIRAWDGKSELQLVDLLIDHMFEFFKDDRFFEEFVRANNLVQHS